VDTHASVLQATLETDSIVRASIHALTHPRSVQNTPRALSCALDAPNANVCLDTKATANDALAFVHANRTLAPVMQHALNSGEARLIVNARRASREMASIIALLSIPAKNLANHCAVKTRSACTLAQDITHANARKDTDALETSALKSTDATTALLNAAKAPSANTRVQDSLDAIAYPSTDATPMAKLALLFLHAAPILLRVTLTRSVPT
jgi:hypothetical protein